MSTYTWLESLRKWDGTIDSFSPLELPRLILRHLGNPQDAYKTVHIAGTNGKGSTACYLAQLLDAAPEFRKVGLIASPHVHQVEERLQIGGVPVERSVLAKALSEVEACCKDLEVSPTYFTAVIAASFLALRTVGVDIAVVEVGLGGALDATNVITQPTLCVITSIEFDHLEFLGTTLADIASAKSGIVKDRSKLALGLVSDEARQRIVATCVNRDAQVSMLGVDIPFAYDRQQSELTVGETKYSVSSFLPNYLAHNLALSLLSAKLLGIHVDPRIVRSLQAPTGRCEVFVHECGAKAWIDGAHNPAGVRSFLQEIVFNVQHRSLSAEEIYLVMSFLERKDWPAMLQEVKESLSVLQPYQPQLFFLLGPEHATEKDIRLWMTEHLKGQSYSFVSDISEFPRATPGGAVFCFGSIYALGRVQTMLEGQGFAPRQAISS